MSAGMAEPDAVDRLAAVLASRVDVGGPELDPATRRTLLDLARRVAHGTERRNAPLATYLAGMYVAGRGAAGVDAASALAEVVAATDALLADPAEANGDGRG